MKKIVPPSDDLSSISRFLESPCFMLYNLNLVILSHCSTCLDWETGNQDIGQISSALCQTNFF